MKMKPPTFGGEKEDVEARLLKMVKYFQVYEQKSILKTRLEIYQLHGKATLWWEEIKMVHMLDEKVVTWEEFHAKFKYRYLNERYYDDKAK